MSKRINATKNLYLLSCILFISNININERERKWNANKNIINKKKQSSEIPKFERFRKISVSCENVNEKNHTLTYVTNKHTSKEYEIKEKEMGKEKNSSQYNMGTILKDEKNELQNKNENGWECSLENEETEKEEITEDDLSKEMKKKIEDILNKYTVVLFMKGTALNPFCKYSKEAIHILKLNRVKEIHTVNVLSDMELKKCLKFYSKWSTFPQLYVYGKFIGGIDKIKELHEKKQLKQILEQQHQQQKEQNSKQKPDV